MSRKARCWIFFALGALSLPSCTAFRALGDRSGTYRSYVDRHLHEERIFDRGREKLVVKIIGVTNSLRKAQLELTPNVALAAPNPELRQAVVALSVSGRVPPNWPDWTFTLGGRKALAFREIRDDEVIENHYFFAYPFYRVMVVDFPPQPAPGEATETLEVQSPFGALAVSADFIEETE